MVLNERLAVERPRVRVADLGGAGDSGLDETECEHRLMSRGVASAG